jgi:hypothetical protein
MVSRAEYHEAVEGFKEMSREISGDPKSKGMKIHLAVIKVKMKKPWVSATSVSYKLKKENVLGIFANAFMEGEVDDLFEVEIKEVEQYPNK